MKECPQCKQLKALDDFKDGKLITGYGRYCNSCKGKPAYKPTEPKPAPQLTDIKCPTCSAPMVVRKRRRDKREFYGCSRYPKCYGTRQK